MNDIIEAFQSINAASKTMTGTVIAMQEVGQKFIDTCKNTSKACAEFVKDFNYKVSCILTVGK